MKLTEKLNKLHACKEAVEWCEGKTFKQAWDTCERGDWMLWLAHRKMDKAGWCDLRNLTLAKARCAKLVIHLMKDKRSRKAVEVAERFGNGDATRKELDAASAAANAAYAAASAAASAAAYAAASAAASASADYDASAAAYAASAASAAKRKEIIKQCADICRETIKVGKF